MVTIFYRGNESGEILDADGKVIGRVVPVEPVVWASPNVIPLTGMRDNFPCILTPFKCEANTVPLLFAATVDIAAAAVRVPSTEGFGGNFAAGMEYVIDALGVKS